MVVITEFMDEDAIRDILAGHRVLYDPMLFREPARIVAQLKEAKALVVRNQTQVNQTILDGAPKLRVIGRLGVGLDNIDLELCRSRHIEVCPARGANDISVAEYVMTAALILLRGAWRSSADVMAGAWPRKALVGQEVFGKRLGMIGFGAIARMTAQRARALGMSIAAYDPYLDDHDPAWNEAVRLSLEEIFRSSDVLSLHVPLTDETRHLVNRDRIDLMLPGAVIIQASRGGVVDEAAVIEALRDGQLGGAALDVFETEPLDAEKGQRFQDLPNLILTPHIAGVTQESNVRVSEMTCRNILPFLD